MYDIALLIFRTIYLTLTLILRIYCLSLFVPLTKEVFNIEIIYLGTDDNGTIYNAMKLNRPSEDYNLTDFNIRFTILIPYNLDKTPAEPWPALRQILVVLCYLLLYIPLHKHVS
jgi:hypothetical protein